MTTTTFDLVAAASAEMIREGFNPDFPDGTEAQVAEIGASLNTIVDQDAQDLRGLDWSSIDNDTSRDLDQIEVAERVDADGVYGGAKFFDAADGVVDRYDFVE